MRKLFFLLLILTIIISPSYASLTLSTDFKNGEDIELSGSVVWLSTDDSSVTSDITRFCKEPTDLSLANGETESVSCLIENPENVFDSGNYNIHAEFRTDSMTLYSKEKAFKYDGCSFCNGVLCSEDNCRGLGKCLFEKDLLGGTCLSCKDAGIKTCEDYGSDQKECLETNPCRIENCTWNGENCVTKKPFRILVVPLVSSSGEPMVIRSQQGDKTQINEFTFTKKPYLFDDDFISELKSKFPCDINFQIKYTFPLDLPHPKSMGGDSLREEVMNHIKDEKRQNDYDYIVATIESVTVFIQSNTDSSYSTFIINSQRYGDILISPAYRINDPTTGELEEISGSEHIEICAHELGHFFGLCDEDYATGSISATSCPTGIATCSTFKDSSTSEHSDELNSNCLACSTGTCCPNKPEKGEASLMCTLNICNRGCIPGSEFSKSSKCHLMKELVKNGYCKPDKEKENEYCS